MIQYRIGDATIPHAKKTVIAHICNDENIWEAGFVLALSKRYPQAKEAYLNASLKLGDVQWIEVDENVMVANMIAQKGVLSHDNPHPIDYHALDICLEKVFTQAKKSDYTVQMPKIGVGLAGGRWDIIEPLITQNQRDVNCIVCLLNTK